jgi:hypothetical protein
MQLKYCGRSDRWPQDNQGYGNVIHLFIYYCPMVFTGLYIPKIFLSNLAE